MSKQIFNSKNACILIIGILLYLMFYKGIPILYSYDLFGHYIYLPMIFDQHQVVYSDLDYFSQLQKTYQTTPTLYQFVLLENGHYLTKYTIGWGVLMSPFYGIAELWANVGGYKSDGFSFPYRCMLAVGAAFYCFLSLELLRKVLRYFFSDGITALVLLVGVFGTNFLFMQYASLGSSHNVEFLLIVMLLYFTIRFHEDHRLRYAILLGLCLGLIAIVRPPDLLCVLIPLGWKYKSYGGFWAKIRYLFTQCKKQLIYAALLFFAIASLQVIYWYVVSGSLLMNSYANNAGEGFDWFTPYLGEVLFSYRKGWFLYTPIMIFACVGFYFWHRQKREEAGFVLLTFLMFLYVASCWTTWWYADSFSQRALVDVYPLLFIALGFFFLALKTKTAKIVGGTLVSILLVFNLFQTFQVHRGILHTSRTTKEYYWSVFGQISNPRPAQYDLLSVNREAFYESGEIHLTQFRKGYDTTIVFPGGFTLNNTEIYTPILDFSPAKLSSKPYFWISMRWTYRGNTSQLRGKIFNAAAFHKGKSYAWIGQGIDDPKLKIDTIAKTVEFRYFTPHFRNKSDLLRLGIWNQGGGELLVEKLHIQIFDPRVVRE